MTLLKICAAAAVSVLASISIAHAQSPEQQIRDRMATMDTDRVGNDLSGGNRDVRDRRGRLLPPIQVLTNAKEAAKASGLFCQVTEAALLGVTNDKNDLFEIACQNGPGYILTSPSKSLVLDCLVLADQAEQMKAAGQELPPNSTCRLKGNQNVATLIAGYAREAGVSCEVDAGSVRGANGYEVGCANADGYIIERKAEGGWGKAPCWKLAAVEGLGCRYSTAAESNSAWTEILGGTEASACAVEKSRQIGVDSKQLAVYEVKCAGASGFLARVNAASKAEQVHACSDPATAGIAGGCILTRAPATASPQ